MSNVFSYEIDERNLRVQLKNLEMPMKEDAWDRFESYAQGHQIDLPKQSWRPVQINLSRNVVLPVIFGLIVFLFSFMLYSFVTIKDDANDEAAQSAEIVAPVVTQKVEEKKPEPAGPEMQISTVAEKTIVPATEPVEKIAENIPVAEPKASEPQTTQQITTQDPQTVQTDVQKKKRRRSREEAISAIRPTVVTEEEPEVEIPQ